MGKRILFIAIALLFLFTSIGFSMLVIWQMRDEDKKSVQQTKLLQEAQKNQSKEGKLEGTKLADFTPVSSVASLQITDLKPGTGAEVKANDTVTVQYTGALAATGVIFESSLDSGQPAQFPLDQVIPGWTQGIPGMKVGGTRRLLIPFALAYGAQGQGPIPANSDLVFDVQLVKKG